MISRFRPAGPTVAVRRDGEGMCAEEVTISLDGGKDSEEAEEASLTKSSSDGPTLRRSWKVVCRRRGCEEDWGVEVSVAWLRAEVLKKAGRGAAEGIYKHLNLGTLLAMTNLRRKGYGTVGRNEEDTSE